MKSAAQKLATFSSYSFLIIVLFLVSCEEEKKPPKTGKWTGYLEVLEGKKLPVRFAVVEEGESWKMTFNNAEETLNSYVAELAGEKAKVEFPVFETHFDLNYSKDSLWGKYLLPNLGRELNFNARPGELTFAKPQPSDANLQGSWQALFETETPTPYPALAEFKQEGTRLTGTIRTTTGDYRYLEGEVKKDSLWLSTFDGAHQFLFLAGMEGDSLKGKFYSGNHYLSEFTAWKNAEYQLPSPDSLTYLLPGYDRLAFSFKDTEGQLRSLEDEEFKGKPVVVQLIGSWCPNCLEESKFVAQYRKEHPEIEVPFVALAFEYAKPEEKALSLLKRHQDRLAMDYPILLAQYGGVDKQDAQQKLPMLSSVWSYPTILFLDQNHKPIRIHAGFNGKATGEVYQKFTEEFHETLVELQGQLK